MKWDEYAMVWCDVMLLPYLMLLSCIDVATLVILWWHVCCLLMKCDAKLYVMPWDRTWNALMNGRAYTMFRCILEHE